jgi:hypothetical protein
MIDLVPWSGRAGPPPGPLPPSQPHRNNWGNETECLVNGRGVDEGILVSTGEAWSPSFASYAGSSTRSPASRLAGRVSWRARCERASFSPQPIGVASSVRCVAPLGHRRVGRPSSIALPGVSLLTPDTEPMLVMAARSWRSSLTLAGFSTGTARLEPQVAPETERLALRGWVARYSGQLSHEEGTDLLPSATPTTREDRPMLVRELPSQAHDVMMIKRVFEEPIEKNGISIIPAANVLGAPGAGSGRSRRARTRREAGSVCGRHPLGCTSSRRDRHPAAGPELEPRHPRRPDRRDRPLVDDSVDRVRSGRTPAWPIRTVLGPHTAGPVGCAWAVGGSWPVHVAPAPPRLRLVGGLGRPVVDGAPALERKATR